MESATMRPKQREMAGKEILKLWRPQHCNVMHPQFVSSLWELHSPKMQPKHEERERDRQGSSKKWETVKNSNLPPLTKLPIIIGLDWIGAQLSGRRIWRVRVPAVEWRQQCAMVHTQSQLNFNCELNRAQQCLFPLVNLGGTTVRDWGRARRGGMPIRRKEANPQMKKVWVLSPYPLSFSLLSLSQVCVSLSH